MPEDIKAADVHSIAVESIPHAFGGVVHAVAAPSPTPAARRAPAAAAAQQSAAIAAQTAQIAAALIHRHHRRSRLRRPMSQALKTSDPNQQMQLYDR